MSLLKNYSICIIRSLCKFQPRPLSLSLSLSLSLLQTALLNVEEQAVLDELDKSFLYYEEETRRSRCGGFCSKCCYRLRSSLTNKGVVSLFLTLVLLLVGIGLLIVVRSLDLPQEADRLAAYIISAGVFGLASGGTNAIAVVMLLYRVPCLYGSG